MGRFIDCKIPRIGVRRAECVIFATYVWYFFSEVKLYFGILSQLYRHTYQFTNKTQEVYKYWQLLDVIRAECGSATDTIIIMIDFQEAGQRV